MIRQVDSSFDSIKLEPAPNRHLYTFNVTSTVEGAYSRVITVLRVGGLHGLFFKVHNNEIVGQDGTSSSSTDATTSDSTSTVDSSTVTTTTTPLQGGDLDHI